MTTSQRTGTPRTTTNIPGGASQPVSDSKVTTSRTLFDVRQNGGPKRYYVIWITRLPSDTNFAHVNEVRAFGS
jgi:hypothetical protein